METNISRAVAAARKTSPTPPNWLGRNYREFVGRQPPQIDWLWLGYLARGCVTLLTSQWKTGKTTLLSVLLARLHTGGRLADRPVATGRAAVVTEEGPSLWNARGTRCNFGPDALFFARPFQGKPNLDEWREFIARLDELRAAEGLDLVVIDTLSSFLPVGAENRSDAMLAALQPLQQLTTHGTGVLLLHHPRKGVAQAGQAPRGSGALSGYCDILIEMQHLRGARANDRRRRLLAWSRRDETPRELVVELSADGCDYTAVTHAVDLGWEDGLEVVRSILERSRRQMTRRMLRDAWPDDQKLDEVTLWRWLERAVERGFLQRHGEGMVNDPFRYSLPGREAPWSSLDEFIRPTDDLLQDRPIGRPAGRKSASQDWRAAARALERLAAEKK